MFAKLMSKSPVLGIGILMMGIWLVSLTDFGKFLDRTEKLRPDSCRSSLVMLNKRMPESWKTTCIGLDLVVEVEIDISNKIIPSNPPDIVAEEKKYKQLLYRELANNLIFIANNSLSDSMNRVRFVVVSLKSEKLDVEGISRGSDIIKLIDMDINNKKLIEEHLKTTVKVKEVAK